MKSRLGQGAGTTLNWSRRLETFQACPLVASLCSGHLYETAAFRPRTTACCTHLENSRSKDINPDPNPTSVQLTSW